MTTEQTLRRGLLGIVVFATAATLVELLLIEHFEDPWQYSPLVLLALVLLAALGVAVAPGARMLRHFRRLMALCVAAGGAGVWLHYTGNHEFELEIYPNLEGWELFRESMMGATPVLAPGTMAVIGLLGLLYAWRHPAWQDH